MGVYLAEQTLFFLQACLVGACLGLLYDAFRITRIAVPTSSAVMFVEDVLFFVVCAVITFFFMLRAIDGQVRFFIILGELLGAVLYFMALSPIIMGVSKGIIRVVHGIIRSILRWLILPIIRMVTFILQTILLPVQFIVRIFKKSAQRCKFRLKVRRIVLYNHFRGAKALHYEKRKSKQDGAQTDQT